MTVGEAVTRAGNPEKGHLAVNIQVKKGGEFLAELLDKSGSPLKGFSAGECLTLTGNHNRTTVTWKGGENAPAEAVKIRFVLKRAFLYGYDWVDQKTEE